MRRPQEIGVGGSHRTSLLLPQGTENPSYITDDRYSVSGANIAIVTVLALLR